MSIFFGGKQEGPTRLNKVQINQSVQGYPLPVVMGRGKVQQSLLWLDGFSSKKIKQGGKGIGGGKGATSYVYSADVIAALCNGPITGIGDVWAGQSWLSNTNTAETYTITGGSPSYTPANASAFVEDQGVSMDTTYTGTYNDVGSPAPTTVSGSDFITWLRVVWGVSPSSGQYSINPADNSYHFSSADAGKTVKLSYSFALNIVKESELGVVPSGKDIGVGGNASTGSGLTWYADNGVIYYTGVNAGKAFTKVSGTPTVAGTYSLTPGGSILGFTFPAVYHFSTPDIGANVQITYKMKNDGAIPTGTPSSLSFSVYEGYKGQSPNPTLASNFPSASMGYSGICHVDYFPMSLGYGAQVQQNVFEVQTADAYGGGIVDCSPIQCILQVLTNPMWGLGSGKQPFPLSAIDNGAGGTWGSKQAGTTRQADSTAWSWFAANGFFISPVIDRQNTAASLISQWLEAGQVAAYMSEGLMKLKPYGDKSTGGNGATWIAPSEYVAALDDSCFLSSEGEEPVKISGSEYTAYNTVQVGWNNRANQYAPEICPDFDQAAIDRYGARIEDPVTFDFITTLPAAQFAASMRVKRNVYNRNTYEFSLPFTYAYLEPMDVVELSTSSVWAAGLNNLNLGIVNLPVRITKIVDGPDGLQCTAEDYPFGVHQPTLFNKDVAAGQVQPNAFADPGDTEAVVFEAPARYTGFQGNQIVIGATGQNRDWGGCNVLVSEDGSTYKTLGVIDSQARLGVLLASFAAGADPDTSHALSVQLVENCPPLDAGTTTDADSGNTLAYVDGELISYSACSVSGQDSYTMDTYIRRGQMGTTPAAHAAGSLFLALDDSVFKFTYDPSWAGKTVYLKFQSFNAFGNSAQDPSTLTPVTFVIPGQNPGTIDASTGLIFSPSQAKSVVNSTKDPIPTALWDDGTFTLGDNNIPTPGWFTFQGYLPPGGGKVIEVFLATAAGAQTGYVFRLDGRSGQYPGQLLALSAFGVHSATYPNIGTQHGSTNAADLAGWYNVDCYYGNGFMEIWVNGVKRCEATDTRYAIPASAPVYYAQEFTGSACKIAPGGVIQSGSSFLKGQGSIATVSGDAFSYGAGTTNIQWTWGAFSIYVPDGTVYSVAANSTGVNFTGLSPSTTYHFYMYVQLSDMSVHVIKSSQSSGTAKETLPTLIQVAQADGRVAVRLDATASTPASGTTIGGGGGTGECFTPETEVVTPTGLVTFASLPKSGTFEIVNETGTHLAKLIIHEGYRGWMRQIAPGKLVTLGHMMKHEGRWIRADVKYAEAPLIWYEGPVYNMHVLSTDTRDHHYRLFNGDVAHNLKMILP